MLLEFGNSQLLKALIDRAGISGGVPSFQEFGHPISLGRRIECARWIVGHIETRPVRGTWVEGKAIMLDFLNCEPTSHPSVVAWVPYLSPIDKADLLGGIILIG